MAGKRIVMGYAGNEMHVEDMRTPGGRQIVPGNGEGPDRVLVALTANDLAATLGGMSRRPALSDTEASVFMALSGALEDFMRA